MVITGTNMARAQAGKTCFRVGAGDAAIRLLLPRRDRFPCEGFYLGCQIVQSLDLRRISKALELGAGKYAPAALVLLASNPRIRIDAVEICPQTLVALDGLVESNRLQGRVRTLRGNLYEPLEAGAKYDLIFSNIAQMPQPAGEAVSVADHAGANGWNLLSRIITKAPDFLNSRGYLALVTFDFLGISERTNPRIPSLHERLAQRKFTVQREARYRRYVRRGGATMRAFSQIVSVYPNAHFTDITGKALAAPEAMSARPIYVDFVFTLAQLVS